MIIALTAIAFTMLGIVATALGFHFANKMNERKNNEVVNEILRKVEKLVPQKLEVIDLYNQYVDEQANQ